MDEVDNEVAKMQREQDKDADKVLQDRLAARRRKKNANLEKQRNLKKDQMQERIEKNLANSGQHMQSKNEMTQDALNEVIQKM